MAWRNNDVRDLVIRTLIGESNGTPEGMTSVAHVMKNRADSGAWGDASINGLTHTITAPKQFSIWNPGYAGAPALRAISPSDPRYQRAGAIADGVFGGTIPDNTGGATHYHTPAVNPDWSAGVRPIATIGGHYFYKLPLGAGDTAGTAITTPSSVPPPVAAPVAAAPAATAPLAPIQSFTGGDYGRQATAAKQPFSGIVIHVTGKPDLRSELAYNRTPDAGRGNAYYGYHYIVDRDGKVYQTAPDDVRTNHIQGNAQHGLNNENAIGVAFVGGAPAGQNPLPMTLEQKAAGIALVNQLKAQYNIAPDKIVGHGELDPSRIKGLNPDGGAEGAEFLVAYRNPTAPAASPATTAAPNPANVAAPAAQPVAATAPAGASPIPPGGSSLSAGSGKGSGIVLQGMMSGGGKTPITAGDWSGLFGGGTPASPAAAPVASPAPAVQPAPAPTPTSGSGEAITSPTTSLRPAWGSETPYEPTPVNPGPNLGNTNPLSRIMKSTPGGPSMGYPSMTSPFGDQPQPPQQTSMLPGSMLSSAQNLLKLLFPSATG